MLTRRAILFSLLVFLSVGAIRAAEEPGSTNAPTYEIETQGLVDIDAQTGEMVTTNGFMLIHRGATLTADRARYNQNTGHVEAEGNVLIEREGHIWTGDKVTYNFLTGKMTGEGFKTGHPPFFAEGEVLAADEQANVYVLVDGALTTDDHAPPGYRVQTKSLVVVPGEYVEARHATLRLGNVPVFYWPYYRRSLKTAGNRLSVKPGYRSDDGAFLLTSYYWYWNEHLDGVVHLDGRMKRGVGAGPDFNWDLGTWGRGSLKSYYLNDQDPGRDQFGDEINHDRYRLNFSHLANPRTNLTLRGVYRYQSDEDVIREFFESEYRDNVQPNSFFEARQAWRNFSLDVYAQPRVNDFYETVERLPDVRFTGFRQQLGPTPLYYESESSAGWYQRKFINDTNSSFSAGRADTYHQVVLPKTFFNWLNIAPRVGGRYTHYTETHGEDAVAEETDRWVFNTGAEMTFKASRVWPGLRNDLLDMDGLRHIIEPSANYVFVPNPHPMPPRLPQFDYLVPTTRLLPIDFPDFNAIDAVDSQNTVRFGLRNRLQTKRRDTIDNLLHWALFMDWRLDPRSDQRTFSHGYSDLDFKPASWIVATSQLRYDVPEDTLREANHFLTLLPNDRWSWSFGHRYLRENDPLLGPDPGNNLFFSNIYYRMNENWGFRVNHRFEAEDGTLEQQQYTIYRDLRAWTVALSLRVRDDRVGPTELTAALTFSLKAFPQLGLGDDVNRPSLLLGY